VTGRPLLRCRPARTGPGPPPEQGDGCAAHPAAASRGGNGDPGLVQRARTAETWPVSVGRATTPGRAGTCPSTAHPMARGHQSRAASVRESSSSSTWAHTSCNRWRRESSTSTRTPPRRSVTRPGSASTVVTGVGSVIRTPVRRRPPTPAARWWWPTRWRQRWRVRNTVRQSGPLQHGVHPRRILLSLTPDAPGVPAQLGTDQLGRRAGRARRAPGVTQRGPGPAVQHVGHRAGHLLSHGVHRLGRR